MGEELTSSVHLKYLCVNGMNVVSICRATYFDCPLVPSLLVVNAGNCCLMIYSLWEGNSCQGDGITFYFDIKVIIKVETKQEKTGKNQMKYQLVFF